MVKVSTCDGQTGTTHKSRECEKSINRMKWRCRVCVRYGKPSQDELCFDSPADATIIAEAIDKSTKWQTRRKCHFAIDRRGLNELALALPHTVHCTLFHPLPSIGTTDDSTTTLRSFAKFRRSMRTFERTL
ncbi:hypothetical protein PHSY_005513 [Pseudozyma hubeiensis SY62]|uniref:Uncharacterized protein n=1 Tax=Pseudozyma hubeiensis (strain SY62) TaxID=1305764 RepID=R9PIL0_PSEHS|nr:hypothetical protein PHSY_005513 [Pseudozyma hubeiensis SY62]GAC97925.1 hypothetical protein PHSY_005513 [Pseudozyma hubeiensis SY62]